MYKKRRKLDEKLNTNNYIVSTNRWIGISAFFVIVLIILYIGLCILVEVENVVLTNSNQNLLDVLKIMMFLSIICFSYLYGKRNGAIEQFKSTIKIEE